MEQITATPADIRAAITEARRSDNPPEAFESLRVAFQPVIDALRALAETVYKAFSALFQQLLPELKTLRASIAAGLTPQQIETAYRRYAERLNAGPRRSRKVSWHRLNRPQRARAIDLYLDECWTPAL